MNEVGKYEIAIDGFRKQLDDVDKQLLRLVAERVSLIEQVGHLKSRHNVPMMQPARVQEVYISRAEYGRELGLDGLFVKNLFDTLLGYSFTKEQQILDAAGR